MNPGVLDIAPAGGLQRFLHLTSGSLPMKWNAGRRVHNNPLFYGYLRGSPFGNVAEFGAFGSIKDTEVEELRWNCQHCSDHLNVNFDKPSFLASGYSEMDPFIGGDEGPNRLRYVVLVDYVGFQGSICDLEMGIDVPARDTAMG